ncbi:MAG: EscU/YscU/HrcU family type III secretion system export apparatus switch protein [Candidatus Marinimicrobia bacterium]|nr:EscU/YscU/HrcU family type III secretion system export apparatus switch protein [Candidatus Neomarinimicrobiota bacterium]
MAEKTDLSAAAIKYDLDESIIPKIIASGNDVTAEEIILIAKEYGIPIKEDPALMEMLMHIEVMEEIPPEAYALVAEVFAFIYEMNLKAKKAENKTSVQDYE